MRNSRIFLMIRFVSHYKYGFKKRKFFKVNTETSFIYYAILAITGRQAETIILHLVQFLAFEFLLENFNLCGC